MRKLFASVLIGITLITVGMIITTSILQVPLPIYNTASDKEMPEVTWGKIPIVAINKSPVLGIKV